MSGVVFLRRLDHELKNPLTAIRAGLVNLADPTASPVQREALSSIEKSGLAPQPAGGRFAQAGRIGNPPPGA